MKRIKKIKRVSCTLAKCHPRVNSKGQQDDIQEPKPKNPKETTQQPTTKTDNPTTYYQSKQKETIETQNDKPIENGSENQEDK